MFKSYVESLFKSPGKRIKSLAKILFFILCGVSVISVIIAATDIAEIEPLQGFIYCVIGVILSVIVSWVSTIMIYAFGDICENVETIKTELKSQNNDTQQSGAAGVENYSSCQNLQNRE
ncbi:MAG: hypothetical protein IJM38_06225 [Ruminococcus sp.]|nr:hypothetical protein [Ruminococcus sp.]